MKESVKQLGCQGQGLPASEPSDGMTRAIMGSCRATKGGSGVGRTFFRIEGGSPGIASTAVEAIVLKPIGLGWPLRLGAVSPPSPRLPSSAVALVPTETGADATLTQRLELGLRECVRCRSRGGGLPSFFCNLFSP